MQHGEIWFAETPGGDRPVLVLTRDPAADRIGSVVVAAVTRTIRGLVSELELTPDDGVPTDCVVNFDNIHTIPRVRVPATDHQARVTAACAGMSDTARRHRMLKLSGRIRYWQSQTRNRPLGIRGSRAPSTRDRLFDIYTLRQRGLSRGAFVARGVALLMVC